MGPRPRADLGRRGPGSPWVVVTVLLVGFGLFGVLVQAQCVDKDATDGEWLPGTPGAVGGYILEADHCAMIMTPEEDCPYWLNEGMPEDHCCICWPGPSVPSLNDLQAAIPAKCKVPLTLPHATQILSRA